MKLNQLKTQIKYSELINSYDKKWHKIAKHKYLSPEFIDSYFFELKPFNIEYFQQLTPYLLFKYGENLNWQILSKTHEIPQFLIEKYKDKVNWFYISKYQKLSNLFILKHINQLKIQQLLLNKFLQNNLLLSKIKKELI